MQLPSLVFFLVSALVQSTWTMLLAVAVKVVSLTAHAAHMSPVTLTEGVLE